MMRLMAQPDNSRFPSNLACGPFITRTQARELPDLARLARVIWRSHYPGIISVDQIDYMLERMYSLERLEQELSMEGVVYFHIGLAGAMVGFAAVGPTPTPGEFKLHKLYVHPGHQRKGYGKALLNATSDWVLAAGGDRMILCVNKRNAIALQAYQAYGFRQRAEVSVDIGGGFVMDDFVLEYRLGASGVSR